jgi:hypothetical protein
MTHILPLEFDLHLSKRPGAKGRPDQFTIAIWDGVLTLRCVGHILAIDEALATLPTDPRKRRRCAQRTAY